MTKQVKCPDCGMMNDKENTIQHSNRYYCKECYKIRSENVDGYKRLISYICKLYRIDKPTGIILRQIKEFKSDYKFTDDGIYMTLKYYYDLLDNAVIDGVGIGIVPYYYEKAKQQYLTLLKIEDQSEEYVEDEKKVIRVDIEKRNGILDNFKKKSINFDGIDWSELDE